MTRLSLLATVILSALALAGCGSTSTLPDYESGTPTGTAGAGGTGANGASTNPLGGGAGVGVQEQGTTGPLAQQGLLKQLVVYFDFDTSTIADKYHDMLAAHADYLTTHPDARIRLEGNTDERGSREYNIGLGERRAEAVRQALMLLGVSADQITTVSYGEERPAATGHDEQAYRLNRRVDIVYVK